MLGMTEHSTVEVARVSIELTSPLSIGSGEPDMLSDAPVVRDAQGLPMIPATSIAGVLRSLWRETHSEDETNALFGYQKRDQGARSMIEVSSAVIHDSKDQPVAPFSRWHKDPVLLSAYSDELKRDHVRLNHRGVVDQRGKFDRTSIHTGHRFTFEVSLRRRSQPQQGEPQQGDLKTLLDLISSTVCRFGGKTRSGFGAFKVVRCTYRSFDLTNTEDFECYLSLPRALHEPTALRSYGPNAQGAGHSLSLELTPEEAWLQGGGNESFYTSEQSKPKIVPYQESAIVWQNSNGVLTGKVSDGESSDFVLTGTAIRGALRHRTAFHFRRLIKHWSNDGLNKLERKQEEGLDLFDPAGLKGLDMLFGQLSRDKKGEEGTLGWRGALLTSDARVQRRECELQINDHLSIDRFSGAPLQGHLFSDAAIAPKQGQVLPLTLGFTPPMLKKDQADLKDALYVACYALSFTLKDLSAGRLQLGAGAGRGYGYFKGASPQWRSDKGSAWAQALNGVAPSAEQIDHVIKMNEREEH